MAKPILIFLFLVVTAIALKLALFYRRKRIVATAYLVKENELLEALNGLASYKVLAPDDALIWQESSLSAFLEEVRGYFEIGSAWNAEFTFKIDRDRNTVYLWFVNSGFPLGRKKFEDFRTK